MNLDCGDSSCIFTKDHSGQRTNGGCRCLKDLPPERRIAVKRYIQWLEGEVARLNRSIREIEDRVLADIKR